MDVRWLGFLFLVCLTSRICLTQRPTVFLKSRGFDVDEAGGNVSVTLIRQALNNQFPGPTEVKLRVTGKTASSSDYRIPKLPASVNFVDSQTEASFEVIIVDDVIQEPDEEFEVEIIRTGWYFSGPEKTFVTIHDNDLPLIKFKSVTISVPESAGSATFTLVRSNTASNSPAVTVQLTATSGTATDTEDFQSSSIENVTFAVGMNEASGTIDILDDKLDENDESFTISIQESNQQIIEGDNLTVTITDDDIPTISLEVPSPTYESSGPVVLTATRTNGPTGEISVDLSIADDTALAGKDYVKPDAAKLVFADGEVTKSIEIQLKDDMNEEKTEFFKVSIVDNANKFNTGVKEVSVEILDDDGPATYDCRRPGQKPCSNDAVCNDRGICECNAIDPPRGGYKCDYVKGNVDKNPCTKTSCSEHGTCVAEDGKAKCYCDAGYEDTEKCLFPRYKVICGKDQMSIQIDPIGNFQGKVYAYGYEDTCTFDDFANQEGMPDNFTSGKVKIIPNTDTNCGNASSQSTDNILQIHRLIYVQYNSQFQFVYDEFVKARCLFDMTKNITLVSLISPVSTSQDNAVQASAQGDLNPLDLGVTKEGVAVSSNTPIKMGEKLMVILSVNQNSEFGALLVVDVMIDNNLESDPIVVTIVKDSCFKNVAGIMSPTTELMVTPDNGVLKIEFEFRPPKFRNSDDIRIRVVAKLCPKSDTKSCDLPASCSSNRRKRSADQYGDKTVDFVFKVSDPASNRVVASDGSMIKHESTQSTLSCGNEFNTGILAAMGVMGVFLLLFVVLSIILFCCLMRRKNTGKGDDIRLPTNVAYQ